MAIYRNHDDVSVRLDSRTVTVSAPLPVSAQRLAAVARSENGGEPIRLEAAIVRDDYHTRTYTRLQQIA